MIKDRLKMVIYIVLGYIGVSIGTSLTLGVGLEVAIGLAIFTVIIGVIGHFTKSEVGYYVSIAFNSIGIGGLFGAIFMYLEYEPSLYNALMAIIICLIIFIVLVYVSCIAAGSGNFYILGIIATIVGYVVAIVLMSSYSEELFQLIFAYYHVGLMLMAAMWIAGNYTEDIIKYTSIATFSIFVVAAIVLLLFVLAQGAGSSSSSKSKSKSGGLGFLGDRSSARRSRLGISRPHRYRRYGRAYRLYSDPYYYYGRRGGGYYTNTSSNTNTYKEQELKQKEEELNKREKELKEKENADTMPEQYSANKKKKKEEKDSWDF